MDFTYPSALSAQNGDTITLSAPAGTEVPDNKFRYNIGVGASGYTVLNDVTLSNNGATMRIPLVGNSSINIPANSRVTVSVGLFSEHVTNPTVAGTYRLGVATSRDTTPAFSSAYTITASDPAQLSAVAGASFARVGTEFSPVEAKVTGANGIATASAFTANTVAGAYDVLASSGDLEPVGLPMRNTPGPATGVDLDLEPAAIPADGASTTTATATVTDEYGNGVSGDNVSVSGDGGQQIGVVTDNGDGTYEARITSTTALGDSTITATVSTWLSVSGEATLSQVKTDAPTVTRATPTGKGAKRNAPVTATFSEAMNAATVDASTFELYRVTRSGAKQINGVTVGLSADGLKATLDPFGPSPTLLSRDAKYKAVVTTGAKDVAGNALDQDPDGAGHQQKAWTFTTGAR